MENPHKKREKDLSRRRDLNYRATWRPMGLRKWVIFAILRYVIEANCLEISPILIANRTNQPTNPIMMRAISEKDGINFNSIYNEVFLIWMKTNT